MKKFTAMCCILTVMSVRVLSACGRAASEDIHKENSEIAGTQESGTEDKTEDGQYGEQGDEAEGGAVFWGLMTH